jgi:hypothetical protein
MTWASSSASSEIETSRRLRRTASATCSRQRSAPSASHASTRIGRRFRRKPSPRQIASARTQVESVELRINMPHLALGIYSAARRGVAVMTREPEDRRRIRYPRICNPRYESLTGAERARSARGVHPRARVTTGMPARFVPSLPTAPGGSPRSSAGRPLPWNPTVALPGHAAPPSPPDHRCPRRAPLRASRLTQQKCFAPAAASSKWNGSGCPGAGGASLGPRD